MKNTAVTAMWPDSIVVCKLHLSPFTFSCNLRKSLQNCWRQGCVYHRIFRILRSSQSSKEYSRDQRIWKTQGTRYVLVLGKTLSLPLLSRENPVLHRLCLSYLCVSFPFTLLPHSTLTTLLTPGVWVFPQPQAIL